MSCELSERAMTQARAVGTIGALPIENISMNNVQLLCAIAAIVLGAILMYGIGYVSGRLYGYRQGLVKGEKLSGQVQHLKGMTDGYVMALQHTPGQRNEYMNNVLLKIGALTPAEIEAERQRRFRVRAEG